ncbi:hypothetical protein HAZT_HAZT000260 [Hyalella azteca]|uniref:Centromere protein J C-terminal domain-containing protein n=1 Tax=Hyalella azteca TaxID=294128 RepID=A0A6A0H810_HYAAZ|nr:hypothetical protein HAZT_HAZT000260 [Hyalella azteca]
MIEEADCDDAIRYPLAELTGNIAGVAHSSDDESTAKPSNVPKKSCLINEMDENSLPNWMDITTETSGSYDPGAYKSPKEFSSNKYNQYSTDETLGSHTNQKPTSVRSVEEQLPEPGPRGGLNTDSSLLYLRDQERPLSSTNKSFEELVSEKLKENSLDVSISDTSRPKRKFLKRGSGMSRFRSPNNIVRESSETTNEPTAAAKPKFSFLKKGTGTRRYNVKPLKIKKKHGTNMSTPISENLLLDDLASNFRKQSMAVHEFQLSNDGALEFMSPIRYAHRRESEELKAFEALEELAEHSSFCSNASVVTNLLRRDVDGGNASTPVASPSNYRRLADIRACNDAFCPDSPHPHKADLLLKNLDSEKRVMCDDGAKARKSVQFCEQGAQILEFSADDDAVSEVPTTSDASEVFNVSDLEILNKMSADGKIPASMFTVEKVDDSHGRGERNDAPLTVHHEVLQFSPPRIPRNSASFPVWEAFGKNRKQTSRPNTDVNYEKAGRVKPADDGRCGKAASRNVPEATSLLTPPGAGLRKEESDLEAHKVLLVSKVHELENEIKTFQTENAALAKLRATVTREREVFEKEKRLFEETFERERKYMEEQFEVERNRLWKEKCALELSKKSEPKTTNNVLEIINLKEEILMLKNEMERRESLNNFNVNKLKNKLKELTAEKKDFEAKVQKISSLEKENLSLKHQLDRVKLSSRIGYERLATKSKPKNPNVAPSVPVIGRPSCSSASNLRKDLLKKSVSPSNHVPLKTVSFDEKLLENIAPAEQRSLDSYLSNSSERTNTSSTHNGILRSVSSLDCSEENLSDGSKVITYANGNKKTILPSGCVTMEYYNGDRKETYRDRIVYFYQDTGTKQTTYLDGSEELEFPNGQMEIKRADTSIEITYPDKSKTVKLPDGTEVHHNSDGTTITSTPSGEKVFNFVSGQREIHGPGFKRREYPDGTAKVIYDDGSSETNYPNGRIRVKDKHGNVISDTKLGLDLKVGQVVQTTVTTSY